MIRLKKYDMIFLDHMMPEMDGIDTLKAMKQSKEHLNVETPVVVLTANAVVGAKEKYVEDGFTDYLSKPIREEELMEVLQKYLPKESVKREEKKDTQKVSGTKTLEERFPSLNVQVGMRCCMNDKDLFLEMLQMYISGDKRELLKKEYAEESWKNYEIYVHAVMAEYGELIAELKRGCSED